MSEPVEDPGLQAILQTLERHRVRYVVIGGAAAQARGWSRATEDLDLTPERSQENLTRLALAVSELHAGFRVERYPEGFHPPRGMDWRTFDGQVSVALMTEHGALDVVLLPSGVHGYEQLAASATRERIPGSTIAVPVASAELILRSKEHAARVKDLEQLPDMRAEIDPARSHERDRRERFDDYRDPFLDNSRGRDPRSSRDGYEPPQR